MTKEFIDDIDSVMSLRTVNLNLLPILQALLTHVSVSRAGSTLGLSQSAVSDALGRLRVTFSDALLVRVGGRMALTPRAVALIEPVNRMCDELETLFVSAAFDPGSASRRFVIGTADYGIMLVAKDWIDILSGEAPGVTLRFSAIDRSLPNRLADRSLDFAIVPEPLISSLPPAMIAHAPLAMDRVMAIFRRGHPLDRGQPLTHADLAGQRFISFHPDVEAIERKGSDLFSGGAQYEPVVALPHITLMPYLLLDSDDIAMVPEGLARRMTDILPIASASLAFAPEAVTLALVWSRVQEADSGHRWFRERVVSAAGI